jgi:hypothetical protein
MHNSAIDSLFREIIHAPASPTPSSSGEECLSIDDTSVSLMDQSWSALDGEAGQSGSWMGEEEMQKILDMLPANFDEPQATMAPADFDLTTTSAPTAGLWGILSC